MNMHARACATRSGYTRTMNAVTQRARARPYFCVCCRSATRPASSMVFIGNHFFFGVVYVRARDVLNLCKTGSLYGITKKNIDIPLQIPVQIYEIQNDLGYFINESKR